MPTLICVQCGKDYETNHKRLPIYNLMQVRREDCCSAECYKKFSEWRKC